MLGIKFYLPKKELEQLARSEMGFYADIDPGRLYQETPLVLVNFTC